MLETLVGLICLLGISNGAIPVNSKMKTFAFAIKNGHIVANEEQLVYSNINGPGVITEQSFVAGYNEDTIIRYYIDGDTKATIETNLLMLLGTGSTWSQSNLITPWGNKNIGHNAHNGGFYNTIRIPFQTSINITITNTFTSTFWFIIRGILNHQIIIGDLLLPKNTKLKLYKNENLIVNRFDYINVATINNISGLLYMTTFYGNSTDFTYLEACIRCKIDNDSEYQFLSSGTEDYFLSAYYFNNGTYTNQNAGLTWKQKPGQMSAYKYFEFDPILFTNSLELLWRNNENITGTSMDCPNKWPKYISNNINNQVNNNKIPQANSFVVVNTYAWVYEYELE